MPAREQPIQSYYPSARLRLIIRFEDYGDDATPEVPSTLPQLRRGVTTTDQGDNLRVENQDGTLVLVGPGEDATASGSPQQQFTSEDKFTRPIDGIIPITASWSQNGIRIADTLNFDIEYRDFPLDPRTIRACAVQFFLGTVSAADFQAGIDGELRTQAIPPGSRVPYNVIPDTYNDENGVARTNLRFEGWVDDWKFKFPKADGPVVSATCTDNTRLLISQDHPSRLAVSVKEPIDIAVANYLANFPRFRGISIEFQPKGETPPTMQDVLAKNAFPPGVGPSTAKGGESTLSVWDYLTDVSASIGLNIRFIGTRVVLIRPRALYNSRFPPRFDDPFQGRDLGSRLGHINRRLMIYGQNIEEMEFERQYTERSVTNIEVRSYNPQRKKTLVARFPQLESGKRQKDIAPGNAADSKFRVISVPGIKDLETLRIIAQQLYEVIGRNETGVTVMTKNLGSFGGGNLDPDILDMQPGDAVQIVIERGAIDTEDLNSVTAVQSEIARRPGAFLRELGFPAPFADAYAAAINHPRGPSSELGRTFRVKETHIDWDKASEGVTIDFDAANYIEARVDAELPVGEEQDPDAGAGEPEPTRTTVESPGAI